MVSLRQIQLGYSLDGSALVCTLSNQPCDHLRICYTLLSLRIYGCMLSSSFSSLQLRGNGVMEATSCLGV